jgi:hypothetical protein
VKGAEMRKAVEEVRIRLKDLFQNYWHSGEWELHESWGITPLARIRRLLYRGGFISRFGRDTGLAETIKRLTLIIRKEDPEWKRISFFTTACFQVMLFNAKEKIEKEFSELKGEIVEDTIYNGITLEAVWIILRQLVDVFGREFRYDGKAWLSVSEVHPYFEKTFYIGRRNLEKSLRGLAWFKLISLDLVADLEEIYVPKTF